MRAALIALLLLPAFVLLAGCANGAHMTDEDRINCRNEGCAAFTEAEIRALVNRAGRAGYMQGWTDAHRQAGRGL